MKQNPKKNSYSQKNIPSTLNTLEKISTIEKNIDHNAERLKSIEQDRKYEIKSMEELFLDEEAEEENLAKNTNTKNLEEITSFEDLNLEDFKNINQNININQNTKPKPKHPVLLDSQINEFIGRQQEEIKIEDYDDNHISDTRHYKNNRYAYEDEEIELIEAGIDSPIVNKLYDYF